MQRLFCQANHDIRIERTPAGKLLIIPPAGGETSKYNASITAQLWLWNEQTRKGEVFDSSGGFKLPNGANRSPDAAWVTKERWDALSLEQKEKFPPICPNFVIFSSAWRPSFLTREETPTSDCVCIVKTWYDTIGR